MTGLLVKNDFCSGVCPMCGSASVGLSGPLFYATPTSFASHTVSLSKTPELWRCRHCCSGFTENAIPPQEAFALYEAGDSAGRWESRAFETEKTQRLVEFISGLVKPGATVLDFGCNDGVLLDFLKNSKAAFTYGVEASTSARCFSEAKGHVVTPSLDELGEPSRFDVIFAMDVIEHLYDIPGFIKKIATRLISGGLLILLTGNINSFMARMAKSKWWYIQYPEHVRFPSLRWLSHQPGFRVAKVAKVHASIGYVHPFSVDSTKHALSRWKRDTYDGLPVLFPDHYAVAIKKR